MGKSSGFEFEETFQRIADLAIAKDVFPTPSPWRQRYLAFMELLRTNGSMTIIQIRDAMKLSSNQAWYLTYYSRKLGTVAIHSSSRTGRAGRPLLRFAVKHD